MTGWLEESWTNVVILGAVAVAIAAVLLAAFDAAPFHRYRPAPRPPEDWPPPDYRLPEDDPFAELFFDAAREQDELEARDADS